MGTSGGSFRRPAEPIRGVESLRIGLAHQHPDYISQTSLRASRFKPANRRPAETGAAFKPSSRTQLNFTPSGSEARGKEWA